MKRATFLWTCGFVGRDKRGKTWSLPVYAESMGMKRGELLGYLTTVFPMDCKATLGIDLTQWGTTSDTAIPDEDFRLLQESKIIGPNETNFFTADLLFRVWCELVHRVRQDIVVRPRSMPVLRLTYGIPFAKN